jgi:phage-related baseplate assembly protein
MNENTRAFPDISFIDTDTQRLLLTLIEGFEHITQRRLFPADPIRLFILWIADIIVGERVLIDAAAKQNVPRFAEGDYLDSLAEIFNDTWRLEATPATTTLRFSVTASHRAVTVPQGTRVSVGEIVFMTSHELTIAAGYDSGEASAVCEQVGTVGNGFLPGEITDIVDLFEFFEAVTNTTVSAGGSQRESDAAFYERLRLSLETFSTAGPVGAYEYWARSASATIVDVKATTPAPGVVDIRVLCEDGTLPSGEIKQSVYNSVSADNRRPLTDFVQVNSPDAATFDIDLTYYLYTSSADSATVVGERVNAAIDEYIAWQTGRMGRDINPDRLTELIRSAGAKRAEIRSPIFTPLMEVQVGVLGSRDVVFGGLENE